MARELTITIRTEAELDKLNALINGFKELEKVVQGFSRKKGITSISTNLDNARNSVRNLNAEVTKLNRNLQKMVRLVDPMAKTQSTAGVNAKAQRVIAQGNKAAQRAQAQALRDQERRLQGWFNAVYREHAKSEREMTAVTKRENAERERAVKKAADTMQREYNQAAKTQQQAAQRAANNSLKLQRTTFDTNTRNYERAMSRLNRATGGLIGGNVRSSEGFMGTLFQGRGGPWEKFDKDFDTMMRRQQTQVSRFGDTQNRLQGAEDNMRRFWNTVNSGAQSLTKRGFSRSLGELNSQLKQLERIRLDWDKPIQEQREYQNTLRRTMTELRSLYRLQNEQRVAAQRAGDTSTAGLRERDMRTTLEQYRTARLGYRESEQRVAGMQGEQGNVARTIQQITTALQRGEQGQARYQARLQQLRRDMAASAEGFRRMESAMKSFFSAIQRASGAIAQFASALRSRLNSAFSAASAGIRTLGSNVSSRFASMRAQLDATGKTFLGFGRQAKTGFSQADIALNEFFSAGWSLLASGSIVKMFGSNILRNMFGGLTEYSALEQQMVRLGISSGMWEPATRAGFTPTGAPIGVGERVYQPGDMRGMEALIFGLQSGRLAGGSGKAMTAFNAEELTDALYFFSSAIGSDLLTQGIATARALEPLLRVASVTQTDPEMLIKGSLNTLMQYGYDPRAMIASGDTDMFTQIAGMIAVASNVSSMEVNDVFEAFKMMGPALHKLTGATEGAGLDDAMAAIFMASEVGLKGGNVGRGLDRLVTQLLDPDGPMKEVIKKYFGDDATIRDLFFNDQGYLKGGLSGVFDTLMKSDLTDPELASLMGELFTQNAARVGLGLVDPAKMRAKPGDDNYVGSWNWFQEQMQAGRVEQFMSTATAAMENTVTASMTNIGNAWQMISTMIVESVRGDLLQNFARFADVLWDIGYAIQDNPAIGRFVATLGLLAGGVAAAVGGMMVFGGTILLVARAFSMLGGMIAPVLQVLMMLPTILASVSPFLLAIGAASAVAFVAWNENLGGIQDKVRGFIDGLSWAGFIGTISNVVTWFARIGMAASDLARGPILGLTDNVNNLHALMVGLFGPALGTIAVDNLMRLGDAIRGVFDSSREGTGFLRNLRQALSDIVFIGSRAGDAIQGFAELVVTGFTGREEFYAIRDIWDTLGLAPLDIGFTPIVSAAREVRNLFFDILDVSKQVGAAWASAGSALFGDLFSAGDATNPLKGLFGGGADVEMYGLASIFDTSVLIPAAQGAFAFLEGMVLGFGTALVRTANLVEMAITRIRTGFSSLTDSLGDSEGRIKGFQVTFEGAMRVIGIAVGSYLGARLVTALLPGFTLLARLGTVVAQLGVMFATSAVQAGLFVARIATGMITVGVQIAAVTAGIIAQTAAMTASIGVGAAKMAITAQNAAMEAAHAAAMGVATAATAGLSAATLGLVAALFLSVTAFAAIVLSAGLLAVGIFAVVAATQGFGEAVTAVVSFLQGFWNGLQIGITMASIFIDVIGTIGGAIADLIVALGGAEDRFGALGFAMGVLGTVAMLSIIGSIGGLIARFALLFVTMERGQLVINRTALRFGLIGVGILLLAGPFQSLLSWIDQALDKLGVLGDALGLFGTGALVAGAISPKTTAKGIGNLAKWGGRAAAWAGTNAVGPAVGAGIASGVWAPLALAALPAIVGWSMYAAQDVPPDVAQMQGFNQQVSGWLGQQAGSPQTVSQYATNQMMSQGMPGAVQEWTGAHFKEYLKQISYVIGESALLTIAQQGELPQGWYEQFITQGGTSGQLGLGTIEQVVNKYLEGMAPARADALRQRWGLEDNQLEASDPFWQTLVGGQVQDYMSGGLQEAITRYQEQQRVAAAAAQNTELAAVTSDTDAATEYWSGLEGFVNNLTGGLLSDIPDGWAEGLDKTLRAIGIDMGADDFIPDLVKLTDFMQNPEFDEYESTFLPGLQKYAEAMNDYEAWVDLLKSTGGDFAAAAVMWTTMNPGTAIPLSRPDYTMMFGTEEQQEQAQDQFEEDQARTDFITKALENFDITQLLTESIGTGLRAVFGDTTGAGAMGTFAETIMGNLQNMQLPDGTSVLEANPWFNQDELMANAAIYGGGMARTETGGKNLQRILRPMLEQTAAELGVNVDDLMKGIPQYYFDPALMATAQTSMFSALEGMDQDQGAILDALGMTPDAETGRVFSEMGMDWAGLTQYAISTAMDGQDWDLSHYLMDAWQISHEQAMAYLDQMGIDAQAIGSRNFEAVEAAYLSSNGEVAAATTEFWEWMADATSNGADMMVDITREEFEKIPEAWRILASNQGMKFNIIDETDAEHQAATVEAMARRIKSAFDLLNTADTGPIRDLFMMPGLSGYNQAIFGPNPSGSGQAFQVSGGSLYDLPGTGDVEQMLNLNRMLAYGADTDATTLGLRQVGEEVDGMITLVNEINGMQITIPAVDLDNLRTGADEMEEILRENYREYKDANGAVWGSGDMYTGGTVPEHMTFEEWVAAGAEGLIDDQGNWIGPKLSEEASAALIFGANVDWDGAITLAKEKTLAIANAVQGTWDRSFSSDTQVKGAIDNMLDTAFEGLETVETRAAEAGKAIREAIVNALGGDMGDEPQEENAGTPQRGAGPGTEGPTAAGPFDSQFTSYGTSAGLAFGKALDAALKVEIDGINFVGEGAATGGPFNSEFEGFARLAATAFGNVMTTALPAAIAPAGAGITLMATGWGTSAGAAFASAFAAAMSGIGGTGGTGTGGGNIGADGSTTPYGPGGGMGIVPEGSTEGSTGAQPVQIPVSLDFTQYDLDIASLNEHIPLIDAATASIDVSIDFTQYDLDIASLNEHIPLIDAASATIDVGIDATEYFNGAGMVLTSLTLLDRKTATPVINVVDNATLTLNTIINLINSIPTSKTSTINVNTNNTTTNTVINRVGVGPTEGFHTGGVVATDWQLVGEKGPELVQLPRGSEVFNNWESNRMMNPQMMAASPFTTAGTMERSAPTYNNVSVTINNPVVRGDNDIKEITRQVSRELGRTMEAATRGQRPRY